MYAEDLFQLNLFLYSVGFGMLSALIYDFFKVIVLLTNKSSRILMLCDSVYSISASFLTFLFFLAANYGRFRIYMLAGIIIGLICWFLSLSNFFVKLISNLLCKSACVFSTAGRIIVLPFRLIIKPVSKIMAKINIKKEKYLTFLKNKLKIHLKSK